MKNVRLVRKDESAVSPVIATILMVAITVVLAAVLYVMVSVILRPPPDIVTMTVSVEARGTNWSVEVIQAAPGQVPSATYLLVRNPGGGIALARTPWTNLAPGNWATYKAAYQDANPADPNIVAGDSLLLDRERYPVGSSIEILSDSGILAKRNL